MAHVAVHRAAGARTARAACGRGASRTRAAAHRSYAVPAAQAQAQGKGGPPQGGPPPSKPPPAEADVTAAEIAPGVSLVRGRAGDSFKFEIEYNLKRGTTENAYVVDGEGEGTAPRKVLVDVPDRAFVAAFVEMLGAADVDVVAKGGSGIAIVLTHIDPKRCQTLEGVLTALRNAGAPAGSVRVLCSPAALRTVEESLHAEALELCVLESVKTGDELDLGGGRALQFYAAATPRWPDLMCVRETQSGTLFSSKFFSAHVATDAPTDDGLAAFDEFGEDWRHYFDCMLAPAARQTKAALQRLGLCASSEGAEGESAAAKIVTIAPMHGPVVHAGLAELVRDYGKWAERRAADALRGRVAVLYASAYGNTSSLAQAIARGAIKTGVGVESLNCEFMSSTEVAAAVSECDAFAIGSPTIGGHMPTPVKEALGAILSDPTTREKPCGVFGSFGWSGEAVDELERRLRDGGYKLAFDPIRVKFTPADKDLQVCEESGTDMGQAVRKRRIRQDRQQVLSQRQSAANVGDVERAMGRVVGSLCVLTTKSKDGGATSGMLASWVSQATFVPPGLTVAVKKDRAVEAFCTKGQDFALNVLSEEHAMEYIKAMSKPFAPGEDRFAAIEGTTEAANGCVVLPKAASVVECKVVKRMEAGDHWVVYATVTDGKVLQPNALTAVHHRKTGTSY